MNQDGLARKLLRFLRHAASSDFQHRSAADWQRRRLYRVLGEDIDPAGEEYLAWRQLALWTAALLLLASSLLSVFGQDPLPDWLGPELTRLIGKKNLDLVDRVGLGALLLQTVATLLVVAAALRWRRVRGSIILARVGWLAIFGTPFIISVVPYPSFMDLSHVPAAARVALERSLGGALALWIFMFNAPKALSLFPGVIRSSLTVKTLVPETAVPGWIAAVAGPFYSLFLMVVLAGIIQTQTSMFLLGGILSLGLSPLVYVARYKRLARPLSDNEAAIEVTRTRRLALIFNLVGVGLLAVFVLRRPNLDLADLIGFLTGLLGNILLVNVVGADFVLGLLRRAHQQATLFRDSELQAALIRKLEALGRLGIGARGADDKQSPRE